ncbi:hypothetical protein LTR62_001875 [Meristemomyces frigidus]|uniref:Decapping nuclease n=1 Tax=Meristemomyces frigidus TaxID=1508187 RepID=A0AAN7YM75_9PEZI|nr:hypothetical protein LTR62_001875 [Meristemomyces frigidus]
MATFDFSRLDQFAGSSTSIRRPREFAYFSYDEDHILNPLSTESLAYYYPSFVDAPGAQVDRPDLSTGFDTFRKRDDSVDEHLDGLLETLQAHEERMLAKVEAGDGVLSDVRTKADIITYRGMMTKILTAAFDDRFGDFEMNATWFQDTIFIEENHAYKEADRQSQRTTQPRQGEASQEMMQYWGITSRPSQPSCPVSDRKPPGYHFETLSVLPLPWAQCTRYEIESRPTKPVSNYAQYCSIVRTGIGSTTLVLGGEVDAVLGAKPENPEDPIPWVELKTAADSPLNNAREVTKYERRLLKYWAQSFLLGVPKIIIGHRSPDGFLTRTTELETQRIPSLVKRGNGTWDGNICINLAAAFLEVLSRTVVGEGVWRIRRRRGVAVFEVFRSVDIGTGSILTDNFRLHREKLRGLEMGAAKGG